MMEYLQTDWAAMTLNDWIGTIVTVVIFVLMIWAYVYTFHPKNKDIGPYHQEEDAHGNDQASPIIKRHRSPVGMEVFQHD